MQFDEGREMQYSYCCRGKVSARIARYLTNEITRDENCNLLTVMRTMMYAVPLVRRSAMKGPGNGTAPNPMEAFTALCMIGKDHTHFTIGDPTHLPEETLLEISDIHQQKFTFRRSVKVALPCARVSKVRTAHWHRTHPGPSWIPGQRRTWSYV
jgi:hypothetical protein